MNFWEARQAALRGKLVRMVDRVGDFHPEAFTNLNYEWSNWHLKREWELVDKPKTRTKQKTYKQRR